MQHAASPSTKADASTKWDASRQWDPSSKRNPASKWDEATKWDESTKRPPVRRAAAALAVVAAVAAALVAAPAAHAAGHPALTPPMGWNSWNAFGKNIDEATIERTADLMVSSGMRDAGYDTLVVDGGWRARTRDADGDMQSDPVTFPSGMKALGDYIHARGLRFGIHQPVDEDDCSNTTPGTGSAPGATYAEKARHDAQTFASWGVDFVKYDWCGEPEGRPAGMSAHDWEQQVYGDIGRALRATGRDITFSMSEYGPQQPWQWAAGVGADMWRTTQDTKPIWDADTTTNSAPMGILNAIDQEAALAPFAGPGHFNDPDMLQIGDVELTWGKRTYSGLTDTEQRTQFSMWSELAAPLMAGNDLEHLDAATRDILLDREVIAVDQDSLGAQATRVRAGDREVWSKPLADGGRAVVLLNRGERGATIATTPAEIGLPGRDPGYRIRDLWAHATSFSADRIAAFVPPHGVAMLRVTATGTPAGTPPAAELAIGAPDAIEPGRTRDVTTTLTDDGQTAITSPHAGLTAPAGWTVERVGEEPSAAIAPGESSTTTWRVTAPADAADDAYDLHATATLDGDAATVRSQTRVFVRRPPSAPGAFVSDLSWLYEHDAFGPVERDRQIGSRRPGDGAAIALGGVTYAKGLGTNAPSEVAYHLGGRCDRFTADAGIDDSTGAQGSADFQVLADGRRVYDSGVVTGTDAPAHVEADVTGADTLTLVVTDAGDGSSFDRADWAGAEVRCDA